MVVGFVVVESLFQPCAFSSWCTRTQVEESLLSFELLLQDNRVVLDPNKKRSFPRRLKRIRRRQTLNWSRNFKRDGSAFLHCQEAGECSRPVYAVITLRILAEKMSCYYSTQERQKRKEKTKVSVTQRFLKQRCMRNFHAGCINLSFLWFLFHYPC